MESFSNLKSLQLQFRRTRRHEPFAGSDRRSESRRAVCILFFETITVTSPKLKPTPLTRA